MKANPANFAPLTLVATVLLLLASCAPRSSDNTQAGIVDDEQEHQSEGQIDNLPLPITSSDIVRRRVEAAIENVRQRDVLVSNGFWTVFHSILGLGPTATLLDDRAESPTKGQRLNALEYIASGGTLRGLEFRPERYGPQVYGLDVINQAGGTGVGQGHQDQFIAEMSQWGLPAETKFLVFGKEYSLMDFVRYSQQRASVDPKKNQELSWTIIAVGQYLGMDLGEWTNLYGENLTFEKMVRYELDASVEQAACGGTHRLFGLTWVYHLHRQQGGSETGIWQEIAAKTNKYCELAKQYQSADGTFSTDYFRGPGSIDDAQLRIASTGHILEWLALALSDEALSEDWVTRAVNALSLQILDLRDSSIEGGSLYHAMHGLLIYYARRYDRSWLGPNDPWLPHVPSGNGSRSET